MKKLIMFSPPLVFVIWMGLLCACHESDNEQILDQLDQVIESKGLYAVRFERRVDSLRRELCTASDDTMRWRTANRLFDSYITYNIDTAARYVALMYDLAEHTGRRDMKFLSTTCDISVLIGRNNIEDAYDRIRSLDTAGITKRMRANYYTQQMVVYGRLASQNTSESRSRAYADTLARIRRVRIGFDGHSYVTRQRLRAIDLLSQQRCDEALDVLLPLYNPRQSSRTLARVAYNIANVYETLGDREQRKYWLARAAVNDLRTPVREYLSLYELALMMFEEKDMERAARYIQCTVADMLSCNYNTRIFHSSQAEMIINQAVVYSINSRSRILTVMVSVFLLLLVIIALLLFHTQRQHRRLRRNTSLIYEVNRRLHERNEQFRIVNDHLRDANKIKDSYVFRYMQLATHYIGRVDEYRMELRKTAKTDGTEALMRKLRSPSDVDRNYRDFYRIFDETFLGIFPDFVERVNELLEEPARFPVRSDGALSTELRILAVMRLGITDSGCIASFLNCASARFIPIAPNSAIRRSARAAISKTGFGASASDRISYGSPICGGDSFIVAVSYGLSDLDRF